MLTPDLAERLASLSEADRLELHRAMADEASLPWIPNAGPQTRAAYSLADVLLYGGQGGGGKTDLILGLPFTNHRRSLIMRRKYTDLSSLIDRAIEINGTRKGYNGAPPPKIRTADNRLIQFGANQFLGDEQNWQGQPFDLKCVGRGTRVVMADGSLKPIEAIRVGDLVQTLEGARRVVRVWPRRVDEAVSLCGYDGSGNLCFQQVQSRTHELLTSAGWNAYDKSSSARPSSIFESIQSRFLRKFEELYARTFAARALRRAGQHLGLKHTAKQIESLADRLFGSATFAFDGLSHRGSDFAMFGGERQEIQLHPLSIARPAHCELAQLSSWPFAGNYEFEPQASDVCSLTSPGDFQGHYSSDSRQYDGRAHYILGREDRDREGGQAYLLRQGDAGRPNPIDFEGGVPGETPRHTPHKWSYVHPYTKEIRRGAGDISTASFDVTPIGRVELFDIEVAGANHYITEAGLINKNCFDEAVQFLEFQIRFHLGWVRSANEGQRCRAILGSNPPISAEGDWIIKFFRPWLDLTYPNPAQHGELRYFIMDGDEDVEVPGPEPVMREGREYRPQSRTFIPAKLSDNPYLVRTNYQSQLDALPEPLRSAVRDGNFMAARPDAPYQVIPMEWVLAAQERWTEDGWKKFTMTAMALDPAGDGKDAEELIWRYGGWFSPLVTHKGKATDQSKSSVVDVFMNRRDHAPVVIDVGGGYANVAIMRFKDNDVEYMRFDGSAGGNGRAKELRMPFANRRAEAWWRFREALDPDQEGGSIICLPPDPELRADLTAPRYLASRMQESGLIQVESKEDLRKRLGRSPGKGDVAVMCLFGGNSIVEKVAIKQGDVGALPDFARMKSTGPMARYRNRRMKAQRRH